MSEKRFFDVFDKIYKIISRGDVPADVAFEVKDLMSIARRCTDVPLDPVTAEVLGKVQSEVAGAEDELMELALAYHSLGLVSEAIATMRAATRSSKTRGRIMRSKFWKSAVKVLANYVV